MEAGDKVDTSIAVDAAGDVTSGLDVSVELYLPGPLHHHPRVVDGALRQEDGLLPYLPGHERYEAVERGVRGGGDDV